MSVNFSIACSGTPPHAQAIVDAVTCPDLRIGGDSTDIDWATQALTLFREHVSTRTTSVSLRDGNLDVDVRVLASTEDWHLALNVMEAVATLADAPIENELGPPLDRAALRSTFDDAYIEANQRSTADTTLRLIDHQKSTMQLPGPMRGWHVGPRLARELRERSDGVPLHTRMLEQMRYVQWFDHGWDIFHATPMQTKEDDPAKVVRLALWQPTLYSVMPAADQILINDGDDLIVLPHARYVELAGSRLTWLDESQTLVKPIAESAMPDLLQRARPFNIVQQLAPTPPQAERSQPARSWWKFWER